MIYMKICLIYQDVLIQNDNFHNWKYLDSLDAHGDASTDQSTVKSFTVGDWVLVKYDTDVFPGEVKKICNDEIKVSVMVPSGSYFKWPKDEDAIFYPVANVIKSLKPPVIKSSRGTFEFIDLNY